VVFAGPDEKDREKFLDKATNLEMEQAAEAQPLLEWFAEKYKEFGATLEFVTNKSQEGSQFVKGFGGIGGILRYKVAFEELGDQDDDDDEFYGSDDDSGECLCLLVVQHLADHVSHAAFWCPLFESWSDLREALC
jgi:peptide chain release factor subunit 1